MRCERCDQGDGRPVRRAKLAERDGKVGVVLGVPMHECSACAQRWLDWEVARRLDQLLTTMLAGDVEWLSAASRPPTSLQPDNPPSAAIVTSPVVARRAIRPEVQFGGPQERR